MPTVDVCWTTYYEVQSEAARTFILLEIKFFRIII